MHSARAFADHYRQTRVSSAVLDADPHQLIGLMLAGARERTRLASACLQRGDKARKGVAIGEASAIIAGLNSALDLRAGGEIASGLSARYDYAQRRLVEANARNDSAPLLEVDGLLADIESAWNSIAPGTLQVADGAAA